MRYLSFSVFALGITTTSATILVSDGHGGVIHNPRYTHQRIDSRNVKIDNLALHAAVRRFNVEQLQNLTSTLPVLIPRQAANLQVFTSALGGATAPAITNSGDPDRPFAVDGDTFPDFATASNRACDNQKNACAKIANEGGQRDGELTVGECDRQMEQCKSAALSAANRSFDGAAGEQQQQQPPPQQGGGRGDDGGQRQDPNRGQDQGQDQGQEEQAPPESVLVSSDENFDFFCDV